MMEWFVRLMLNLVINVVLLILIYLLFSFFDVSYTTLGLIITFSVALLFSFLLFKDLKDKIEKKNVLIFKAVSRIGFTCFFYFFFILMFDPSMDDLAYELLDEEVNEQLEVKRARDTYPFLERETFFKFSNNNKYLEKDLLENGYEKMEPEQVKFISPFWFPNEDDLMEYTVCIKNVLEKEKVTYLYISKDKETVYGFVLFW